MTPPTPKPAVPHRGPVRPTREANLHLPPHLREVCALLAVGLVRVRSRSADDIARDLEGQGESSLHFGSEQSGGGARATRRAA